MKAILKSLAIILVSIPIIHADEYTGREKSETCLGCHAIEVITTHILPIKFQSWGDNILIT